MFSRYRQARFERFEIRAQDRGMGLGGMKPQGEGRRSHGIVYLARGGDASCRGRTRHVGRGGLNLACARLLLRVNLDISHRHRPRVLSPSRFLVSPRRLFYFLLSRARNRRRARTTPSEAFTYRPCFNHESPRLTSASNDSLSFNISARSIFGAHPDRCSPRSRTLAQGSLSPNSVVSRVLKFLASLIARRASSPVMDRSFAIRRLLLLAIFIWRFNDSVFLIGSSSAESDSRNYPPPRVT